MESQQHDIGQAVKLLGMAAAADPGHAPVFQLWGKLEAERNNVSTARKLFKKAAEADPDHVPNLHVSHGSTAKYCSALPGTYIPMVSLL